MLPMQMPDVNVLLAAFRKEHPHMRPPAPGWTKPWPQFKLRMGWDCSLR